MQRAAIDGLIFISGIAIGFVIGAKTARKNLESEKQAEVEEIRSMYASTFKKEERKEKEPEKKEKTGPWENAAVPVMPSMIKENPSLKEVAKAIIKEQGYSSDHDGHPTDEDEDEEEEDEQPILERIKKSEHSDISYVIAPAMFGEQDYEEIELTYYADGVLCEGKYVVDDPEDIVGPDALTSFGEYEDDAVYVRNDSRRCDYAIYRDERNASDVLRGQRR